MPHSLKHTHQYVRSHVTRTSNRVMFKCQHPKCYHTAFKDMLEGKASVCNSCGNEFILTDYDLKMSRPQCLDCKDTKEAKEHRAAKEVIAGLLDS